MSFFPHQSYMYLFFFFWLVHFTFFSPLDSHDIKVFILKMRNLFILFSFFVAYISEENHKQRREEAETAEVEMFQEPFIYFRIL